MFHLLHFLFTFQCPYLLPPILSTIPARFKLVTALCIVLYETPKQSAISDNEMSFCSSIISKTLIFIAFPFRTSFVLLEILFVETADNLIVMSSPTMLYFDNHHYLTTPKQTNLLCPNSFTKTTFLQTFQYTNSLK